MADLKQINDDFQGELKKHLDDFNDKMGMDYWKNIVHPFILQGGKRIRPLLFLFSYQAFGGRLNSEIYKVAVALELLHHCALAHDDIIDKSSQRRGKPTLPQRYQEAMKDSIPPNLSGSDYALLAGDILYTCALSLIHGVKLNPKVVDAAMDLILKTARETTIGQYYEMTLSHHPERILPHQIDAVYENKSARYTFCCPLQMGVVLNSGDKKVLKIIERVGLDLGYAYQVQDDLNDFWTELGDAAINRITLPHFFLLNMETPRNKKRINRILGKTPIKAEDMAWLMERFEKRYVEDCCLNEISFHLSRAMMITELLPLDSEYFPLFQELLEKIFPDSSVFFDH